MSHQAGGAENAGVENAGADCRGGKCMSGNSRSDKVLKAIRRKYSKVRDEIRLSWLSCLLDKYLLPNPTHKRVGLLRGKKFEVLF